MSRLTITLSEARYRALKEAAVQRDKTRGQLIDESLDFYGIKSREDARVLVRRTRAHGKLTAERALSVAQENVRSCLRPSPPYPLPIQVISCRGICSRLGMTWSWSRATSDWFGMPACWGE